MLLQVHYSVTFAPQNSYMFNRYWRSYPWFFQLVQFIILILVLSSFFVLAVTPVTLKLMNVSAADIMSISESSSQKVINVALLLQLFTATGIFLLPAVLFAYFTHPRPVRYLGLVKPGRSVQWLLAPLVILSATPLFLFIAEAMSFIDFGEKVKQAQEANDRVMKGLLSGTSIAQFLGTFVVLAIMPGISEELFFRGLLMRFAARRSRSIWFPILVSALLFALMHSNPYGMLSIFLAGVLLAGIYYLTGSLFCSMLAHACYNGLQVLLTFLAKDNKTLDAIAEGNHVPLSWVLIGTPLFLFFFFLLWKNRTPLPRDWSEDFTPEELIEEAQ